MLRDTITRVGHLDGPIVIVASADGLDRISAQIGDRKEIRLIGEPVGRNTGPAVAAAALAAAEDDILLVLPADHHIGDIIGFRSAVDRAAKIAAAGLLVTFGVVPTRVETGFGYILPSASGPEDGGDARFIDRFVEKPEPAAARDLIEAGALWNSGMFVFPVAVLLEELSHYAPEILEPTARALRSGIKSEDRIELGPEFGEAPARPIDVAVMEPTDRAAVVPLDAGWSDVGSWESLWELGDRDRRGNVVVGDVVGLDATNNYLRSEGPLVAVIGVEGLVVVATQDSVLVVPRDRAQDVRNLVEMIEDRPQGK